MPFIFHIGPPKYFLLNIVAFQGKFFRFAGSFSEIDTFSFFLSDKFLRMTTHVAQVLH